jgi:hypothetical protein
MFAQKAPVVNLVNMGGVVSPLMMKVGSVCV